VGAAETAGTLARKWASKTERCGGGKDFFRGGSVHVAVVETPGAPECRVMFGRQLRAATYWVQVTRPPHERRA